MNTPPHLALAQSRYAPFSHSIVNGETARDVTAGISY
jgi:hypothetical protein